MANFQQHVNSAVVASGVLAVSLHSIDILDTKEAVVVIFLGILGGVLPDIDLDSSKPVQIAFRIFSIIIPLLVLLSYPYSVSLITLFIIWGISSLILHLIFFKIFLKATSHRGIFHSIPMGILFAEITTGLFYYFFDKSSSFSTLAGFFIFLGFIVHLFLDEIYSVNVLGLSTKKSFGTALKFYSKNNSTGFLILYVLVVVTFFVVPHDSSIYINIYEIIKNYKVM